MSYKNHLYDLAILVAEERISSPVTTEHDGTPIHYEHSVGNWMTSVLSRYLGEDFLIGPEMFNRQTNKKPDLTIQKYDEDRPDKTKIHLCVELKKKEGDSLHKALSQLVRAIHQMGESTEDYEVFAIVQRGMEIGFFEYYSFAEDDLKDLDNFEGCVPLTYLSEDLIFESDQAKDTLQNLVRDLPDDIQHLRKTSLQTQCVFDLELHKEEINTLFWYIATHSPRKVKNMEEE